MKIIVLNCGSSSIKYQLFDMPSQEVLAKGLVDKIGLKGASIKHKRNDGAEVKLEGEILDHQAGIEYLLGILVSEKYGSIRELSELNAVGHRVVHAGERFSGSVKITHDVIDALEECIELAPLHNPPNLEGIYAITKLLPEVPQVGVFDTAFHQTMKPEVYLYAIPYSLYEKYKIRRYGFHGSSHKFVSRQACRFLGLKYEDQRIITCHLGNGASIAAIRDGKSFDTSMGMTPTEGLIMGTRCGDLDICTSPKKKKPVSPLPMCSSISTAVYWACQVYPRICVMWRLPLRKATTGHRWPWICMHTASRNT